MSRRTKFVLLVLLIVAIAFFARFWRITSMPGGLFPDQAANGEDALAILSGDIRPFYERGNGRESLFFMAQAAFIAVFGIGVWPMFAASALIGSLTVLFSVLAARRMFGNTAAVFTGLFMAANQWHVTVSRTGFRAIMAPLFIALTFWFLALFTSAKTRRAAYGWALAAGAAFALGWYTYIAYRAFIGVVFLAAILWLINNLSSKARLYNIRRQLLPVFLGITLSAAVALPLMSYFYQHPGSFLFRSSHIAVTNKDLSGGSPLVTLGQTTAKSFLAYFTKGDENPRHNVPGYAFLPPVEAVLLALGIIVCLGRSLNYFVGIFRFREHPKGAFHYLMLATFAAMLAPAAATAADIPHGLRAIGTIPAVFWIAGVGAAWLWDKASAFPAVAVGKITKIVLSLAAASSLAYAFFLYFAVMPSLPEYWYQYRSDLTKASALIIAAKKENAPLPYLALDDFSVQTVHFLTTNYGYPYVLVKPEESHKIILNPGERIIFTQSTLPDADRFRAVNPEADESVTLDRFGMQETITYSAKR